MDGGSSIDEASELHSCTIGIALNDSLECHKTTYCRRSSLIALTELPPLDLQLLQKRISPNFEIHESSNLCTHHKKILLNKFEGLQRRCCDPFSVHSKPVRSRLRPVSVEMSDEFSADGSCKIVPGWKLCQHCLSQLKTSSPQNLLDTQNNSSSNDSLTMCDDPDFPVFAVQSANKSLEVIDCSPMKVNTVPKNRRISYGKRKLKAASTILKHKFAAALEVEPRALHSEEENENNCSDCNDLDSLIKDIKEKCSVSSKAEIIHLLTIVPRSWTISKICSEFEVSEYLARKARDLRNAEGILAHPPKKQGKRLPSSTEKAVTDFYEDNEVSRICPGKKDCISVKVKKEPVQKRLLLCNLNEMHQQFVTKTNIKIGISKFCELRPKWCITVGASGTHSVCVCTIHQNLKLMLSAIDTKLDYHEMMHTIVCDENSKECMIHRCDKCPGIEPLRNFLKEKTEADYDLDDEITYKQWVSTDRTTLVTQLSSIEDFIETAVKMTDNLTVHHFISKHQSAYLSSAKKNLVQGTCIVILDFAENYSFIVQDAAQGYHWENSQATLHPFSVYYKDDGGGLQTLSLCVISDHMKHDTVTVHAFQNVVLTFLKQVIPCLTKVIYFSDGAASQYKNFKNLANLLHHVDDYELEAEWNFFATSHGKNTCDGIGGTVKRLAARASLQRTLLNHIMTPLQLFDWCKGNISGISFFFIPTSVVVENSLSLSKRFATYKTFPGTRENHQFVPLSKTTLKMARVSEDPDFSVFDVTTRIRTDMLTNQPVEDQLKTTLLPGQYTACMYERKWYVGSVIDHNEEEGDYQIKFMHPSGPSKSFMWPTRDDICWVAEQDIICLIPVPTTITGRQYQLNEQSTNEILQIVKYFKN